MSIEEKMKEDHVLAPYCTYQIGGPADFFVEVRSGEELQEALTWTEQRDLPYFVFGAGSNLLFDDGGFRGLVIRYRSDNVAVDGERVHADAGTLVAKVVKAAADSGLTGLEAWNGLPGTVGGAVRGNAGCFGTECKDVLESAEVFLPGEGIRKVGVDFLEYGYRDSRLKREGGVVLSATFKLRQGNGADIKKKMMEIARSRIQKQPPGLSTGSFFKNPLGDHAGRLIEAAGLKGAHVGKARISDAHANFFMNAGGATAADVLALADLAEKTVQEKFGIKLEREVVYLAP